MRKGYREPFEGVYREVDNRGLCVYCGDRGKGFDHFLPVTVYSRISMYFPVSYLKMALYQVRCCQPCNAQLGAAVLPSFSARFRFVKDRLRNKYSYVLDMPYWSNSELAELGRGLRDYVAAGQEQKAWVQERIDWSIGSNPDYAILARIRLPLAVLGNGSAPIAAGTRTGILDLSESTEPSTTDYAI